MKIFKYVRKHTVIDIISFHYAKARFSFSHDIKRTLILETTNILSRKALKSMLFRKLIFKELTT